MSSTQDSLKKELTHIKTTLHHCQFPSWALNQWEHKFNQTQPTTAQDNNSNSSNSNKCKATIVVPYIKKTAEKFKRLCKNRGIQVHFRGTNTLRTALGNPKDKDPKSNQTDIIYKYQCPHIQCTSSCIGESGRSLGERVKEHFKAPFSIHHTHCHHRTSHGPQPIQHSAQGGKQPFQDHQRGYVHMCAGPSLKQELRQIPAATHMGQPPTSLNHIPTQANTTTNYQHITPHWFPLPTSPQCPFPPSHYPFKWGAYFFLLFPMVSKHIHP